VTQIGSGGVVAATQGLVNLLATSFSFTITIDAFLMGLIAGKLGEGELSLGFRHGVAMVAIVVLTYMLSPYIAGSLFGSFRGLSSSSLGY
jgi:flagellar protein FlaJ